ncbi:MAG: hypothetical protein DRR16_05235 [Candidatus Parabeggiatoa sp. nov. 3]|nr:MAG: hypothetical protein DRR00_03800 [Gammaproteobacteria bacterium]RKZ68572.1 MAG: hypothetical protein DRQ99_03360 [Gammaproteobacteria bacterium]RKZ88339.1 MAG: hypothetical protein DRR16_05235 [Gammaproteobacteria bacterium]
MNNWRDPRDSDYDLPSRKELLLLEESPEEKSGIITSKKLQVVHFSTIVMVILLLISIGFNVKLLESKQSCDFKLLEIEQTYDNLNKQYKSLIEKNKILSESKRNCDKSSTEDIKNSPKKQDN